MNIADLKGRKITVMGLGLHGGGVGTVRFLSNAGAVVTVTDIKSKEELASSVEKLKGLKNVSFVFNQHRPEDFTKTDMVVKNPAAPWTNKYIKMALEKKIPVEVDSSLFFKLCHNEIIGVTGTKGKTTTSSLIFEMLKSAGKNPIKVGIGQTSVLDKYSELKKDSIVVFELSSWRLSALGKFGLSPKVAVITNILQDHLNYYKTMGEYIADKKNIYKNQKTDDVCIINADDRLIQEMEMEIKSRVVKFSKSQKLAGRSVYINDEAIYLNNGIDENKVVDVSAIKMRGEHNIDNILASIAVASLYKIGIPVMKKVITTFSGVVHRLEFVREVEGIRYYNDTAATTPESGLKGLASFTEPVVLICGGSDKNLDATDFGKFILQKAKDVVFLKGPATEKIITAMKANLPSGGAEKQFEVVDSMEKAVEAARKKAEVGDVVLLSPGAASFGLFVNEFDRGDKFKEAVKNLK